MFPVYLCILSTVNTILPIKTIILRSHESTASLIKIETSQSPLDNYNSYIKQNINCF